MQTFTTSQFFFNAKFRHPKKPNQLLQGDAEEAEERATLTEQAAAKLKAAARAAL